MFLKITPPRIRQLAVAGVALSLLFLGCERDEVQEPNNSQTLSQQEAMNLFFKTYQRKEDDFRDEVVSNLLAMNDSTGIIFDLVQKYGQPRWEVERTISKKSENLLFVPICNTDKNFVTAVFVFKQDSSSIKLNVYDIEQKDSLASDFLLLYQCALYPKQALSSRKAIPIKQTDKEWVTLENCHYIFYSTDGGKTWHFSYSICREEYYYIPTSNIYMIEAADYDTGGGGYGGVGISTLPNTSTLTTSARSKLSQTITKLLLDYCPNQRVYDSTWTNKLTININPSLSSTGSHRSGIIEFRSAASISDISLLHELFHEYQDKIYGIIPHSQLKEFEAWLYVDLYLWHNNREDLTWTRELDPEGSLVRDYRDWIDDIYENGFNDSNMASYMGWFNEFMKVKNTTYGNYPLGTNTNPEALLKTYMLCNY